MGSEFDHNWRLQQQALGPMPVRERETKEENKGWKGNNDEKGEEKEVILFCE